MAGRWLKQQQLQQKTLFQEFNLSICIDPQVATANNLGGTDELEKLRVN